MPRVATEKVSQLLAERLVNRGHYGSLEWITAWCRRWGSRVAQDTATDPLYRHQTQVIGEDTLVYVGSDRVPIDIYREWKDLQDGSRTIRGTADGKIFWED